jgi:hypothetical protein
VDNIHALCELIAEEDAVAEIDESVLFATHIASNCLIQLEEFDDCVSLLEPLINKFEYFLKITKEKVQALSTTIDMNLVSALFCAAGRSFDRLDNRMRSVTAFKVALILDVCCVEALDYMDQSGILAKEDAEDLSLKLPICPKELEWVNAYRRLY